MKENWLILGHYGGHNTGDDAMLNGLLAQLLEKPETHVAVVAKDAGAMPPIVCSPRVTIVPMAASHLLQAVFRCTGIIVGGGTHFHDDYEGRRYVRHYRYLLRFVLLFALAKALRKEVFCLSVGYGPLSRTATKLLTRLGLAFCDLVTVRDRSSLEEIADMAPPHKQRLAFDLAALLPVPATERNKESRDQLLGLSALSMKYIRLDGASFDQQFWHEVIRGLICVLQNNASWRVRIFTIRGGERESDVDVSQWIYEQLIGELSPDRIELLPYVPDPVETLQKMKECRAFVATRYHAGVLAYLAGCRLLFLPYHRKVLDLAAEIGLSAEACLPFTSSQLKEQFVQKVQQLMGDDETFVASLDRAEAYRRAFESVALVGRSNE